MGDFGEATAEAYQLHRADQDAYAAETLTRARAAIVEGAFACEIAAIKVPAKGGERLVESDEHPLKVFAGEDPVVEARLPRGRNHHRRQRIANADGAAALVLMRRSQAERDGLPILAEIKGPCQPQPGAGLVYDRAIPAIRKLLDKTGWRAATSTCSRSTKPSRSCRWPPPRNSGSRATGSTSMAGPARSATRSARPARG